MAEAVLNDIAPEVALPPTQDELPCDDGVPMETSRHKHQMDLLIYPLRPWLKQHTEDGYVGGNMFLYFSLAQVKNQDFRGPDVFVALGVPYRERKSWVVWEEGKGPDIVIELLSDKTAAIDKGEKKRIYQDQVRVAEYYWFDPFDPDDWAGFDLHAGIYEPIVPDDQGRLISQRLGLALVRWYGVYEDAETTWLRWATLDGVLPTPQEALGLERQRAETERQRAETERQQTEAERQRADAEARRAEAERQRAKVEAQRAEAEAQRATVAEAEVARLRALLTEAGHSP
jgi:Uma2 family endonuclease